jgi:hypothetical protein
MYTLLIPALMLNKELSDILSVTWATSDGKVVYQADFSDIKPPPFALLRNPVAHRGDVHALTKSKNHDRDSSNSHFPHGHGFLPSHRPRGACSLAVRTADSVDLRPMTSGIMNQGDLGTCGVSAIVSFLEFITGERLSVLFLYWTTRVLIRKELAHDDSGVELEDVLEALRLYGVCRNERWPYDVCRFADRPTAEAFAEAAHFKPTAFLPVTSMVQMKAILQSETPLFADVFFSPQSYGTYTSRTGIVPKAPDTNWDESCIHTCLIMGYDEKKEHFIFQNTWGTAWGSNGFGFLPYDYIHRGLFRHGWSWGGEFPTAVFAELDAHTHSPAHRPLSA